MHWWAHRRTLRKVGKSSFFCAEKCLTFEFRNI
nr:MAG TPA: hypothetical protein [Caudoviricetes sp.]